MSWRKKIAFSSAVFLFFLSVPRAIGVSEFDFYVDSDASENGNGSKSEPYRTITEAMDRIKEKNLKNQKVFIANGTYGEDVVVENNTSLYGESRGKTVIDAGGKGSALLFNRTKSIVRNLTARDGHRLVVVDSKSKVTIKDCTLSKARRKLIDVEKSTNHSRYQFTLEDSTLEDSQEYGIYCMRRKILINDCEIVDNGQEAIDLHKNVKGEISGNTISGNGESGIEMILTGASVKIKNNTIKKNKAQGIAIQVYDSGKGRILVSNNTIIDNSQYGIRYPRYVEVLPMKYMDFLKKYVSLSGNTIHGNGLGDYFYK